jgi:ABC-type Fe3+/spermidine/putrescine transport system ATPase subunit
VERALDLVQIGKLAERQPTQLSGGQKQRVALARAIVNEPAVLLLDEPLAALDVKLRRELQQELHSLQRRLGITFIHVTHDQDEALGLSDRVAVMDHGRVAQTGTTAEIYEQPRTRFVAEFVGGCNILDVDVEGAHLAKGDFGPLSVAGELTGKRAVLALRPERILLGSQAGADNQFKGEVIATTYTGPETHFSIRAGSMTLKAVLMNCSGAAKISVGETITFSIPKEALLVVDGSEMQVTHP